MITVGLGTHAARKLGRSRCFPAPALIPEHLHTKVFDSSGSKLFDLFVSARVILNVRLANHPSLIAEKSNHVIERRTQNRVDVTGVILPHLKRFHEALQILAAKLPGITTLAV